MCIINSSFSLANYFFEHHSIICADFLSSIHKKFIFLLQKMQKESCEELKNYFLNSRGTEK